MKYQKARKITSFLLLGLMLLGAAIIAGCGNKAADTTQDKAASPALTGTLTIAGSTSVQPFSEVLAEKFMAKNKGVQVNVQGGGTAVGIESAISGAAGIGSASRALTPDEKTKLKDTTICLDGIAIVVHPSNTINGLKSEEIMNIYVGNVKNWKEVGGPDAPITVVTREDGSGTRDGFVAMIMNKKDIVKTAIVQNSTGAVRTTVAGDKNAIGYISLADVNKDVKALTVDGIEGSVANILNGSYKLQRPFVYVTKDAPAGLAKAYIDFVLSPEGQQILVDNKAVSTILKK
jgi:phosphate transport system substrate-binding protein